MPFTGAAAWRRAAVFITSPAAIHSPALGLAPRATTTSPVLMPMRTESCRPGFSAFIRASRSRIAKAAWIARSGSSSWAMGAPNSAIIASPAIFSTVPPNRSSSARARV
jgi:hypothetical protein